MRRSILLFTLLGILAGTVSGQTFTVTLENGSSFETRYRPVPSGFDPEIVLIITDRGNWIGLREADIVDVSSQVERSGFGYQVDTSTIFVGWTPNDADDLTEEGEELNLEEMFPEPEPAVTLQQFVDIPAAGQGIGTQAIDSTYVQ